MIEANKIRGHAFGMYGKTLDLATYDSIGVYFQIRLRDFATQISMTIVDGVRLRKYHYKHILENIR